MEYRSIFSPIPQSPQAVANSPLLAKTLVPAILLPNDDFGNDPKVTFSVVQSHKDLRDDKNGPNEENCISSNEMKSFPGLTMEERSIDSAIDSKRALSKIYLNRSQSPFYKRAKEWSNVYSDTFNFDEYVNNLELHMEYSILKCKMEIEQINKKLETLTNNDGEQKQELEKQKSIFKKLNDHYKSFLIDSDTLQQEQYIPKAVREMEKENEIVPELKPIYKKALTDFVKSLKSKTLVNDRAKFILENCQSKLKNFLTGDYSNNKDDSQHIPDQHINSLTCDTPNYIPTPIQSTSATSETIPSSSYTKGSDIDLNFVNFNHLFDENNHHKTNLLPATNPLTPTMLSYSPNCNRNEFSCTDILSPSSYLAYHGCNQDTVDLTQLIPDNYLISYSGPTINHSVENVELNGKGQTEVLSSATINNAAADGQDGIPKMTNDHHSERVNYDEKTDKRKEDQKIVSQKYQSSSNDSTLKSDQKRHSKESIVHAVDKKKAKYSEETDKRKEDKKIISEKSQSSSNARTLKSDQKRHSKESIVHAEDKKKANCDKKASVNKKTEKLVIQKLHKERGSSSSRSGEERHSNESIVHAEDKKKANCDKKTSVNKKTEKLVIQKLHKERGSSSSRSGEERHSKRSLKHKDQKKTNHSEKKTENMRAENPVTQRVGKDERNSRCRSYEKRHSNQSFERAKDHEKTNQRVGKYERNSRCRSYEKEHSKQSFERAKDHRKTTENMRGEKLGIQEFTKGGRSSLFKSDEKSRSKQSIVNGKDHDNVRYLERTSRNDNEDERIIKNDKEDERTTISIKKDAIDSRKGTDHEGENESDDGEDEENLLRQFRKQIKRSVSFNTMPLAETIEYLKRNRNPMMDDRSIAEALRGRTVPVLDSKFCKKFKISEYQKKSTSFDTSLLKELKAPKRSSFQESRNHQNQPTSLKVVFSNSPDNCDLDETVYPEHIGKENITISSVISKVLLESNYPFEGGFIVHSSNFGNVFRQQSVGFAAKDHVTPHHFFRKETNHTNDLCLFQIYYGCIPKTYETELVHLFKSLIRESINRKETNVKIIEGEIETLFASLWLVTTQDLCDWEEEKRRAKQKCILAYLFYRMKSVCQNISGDKIKVKNLSENECRKRLTKFQQICDNIGILANFGLDRQTFTLSKAVMMYIKLKFQSIHDVLIMMSCHYECIGDNTGKEQTRRDLLTWFKFFRESKTYHYLSPNTVEAMYLVRRQIVDHIQDNYTKTGTVVDINGQSNMNKRKEQKNSTYLSSVSVKTIFSNYIKKSKIMQKKLLQSLNSLLILVHEDLISFLSRNFYMNLPFKMKMHHLESFIQYHMHKLKITHFISNSLNTPSDRRAAKMLKQRLVQKLKLAVGNQGVRPELIVVQSFDEGIMEHFLRYFVSLVSYATSLIRPCDVEVNMDEVEQIVIQNDRSAYERYPVYENGSNDEVWGNFIIGNIENFIEDRMNTIDSLNYYSTDHFLNDSDDSDFDYESEVERMKNPIDSMESCEMDWSDEEDCEWNDKEEVDNVDQTQIDRAAKEQLDVEHTTRLATKDSMFDSDTENDSSCDTSMQRTRKSRICYNIKPRQRTTNRPQMKNKSVTKNEEVLKVRTSVGVSKCTKTIIPMSNEEKQNANFIMKRRRKCKLCNEKLSKDALLLEDKLAVCACPDCFVHLNNLLVVKDGDVDSVLSLIAERIKARARAPVAFTDDGKLLDETEIKYMPLKSSKDYNLYSEAEKNSNPDTSRVDKHDKKFHQTPNEVKTENNPILHKEIPTDNINSTVDVSASGLMMPNVTTTPSFDEVEMAIASIIPLGDEYNSGLLVESMESVDSTFTLVHRSTEILNNATPQDWIMQ